MVYVRKAGVSSQIQYFRNSKFLMFRAMWDVVNIFIGVGKIFADPSKLCGASGAFLYMYLTSNQDVEKRERRNLLPFNGKLNVPRY